MSSQWQPTVFYELSEQARQTLAAIVPLLSWAGENPDFFAQAQAARGTGRGRRSRSQPGKKRPVAPQRSGPVLP
jgi:hypothetical protein